MPRNAKIAFCFIISTAADVPHKGTVLPASGRPVSRKKHLFPIPSQQYRKQTAASENGAVLIQKYNGVSIDWKEMLCYNCYEQNRYFAGA